MLIPTLARKSLRMNRFHTSGNVEYVGIPIISPSTLAQALKALVTYMDAWGISPRMSSALSSWPWSYRVAATSRSPAGMRMKSAASPLVNVSASLLRMSSLVSEVKLILALNFCSRNALIGSLGRGPLKAPDSSNDMVTGARRVVVPVGVLRHLARHLGERVGEGGRAGGAAVRRLAAAGPGLVTTAGAGGGAETDGGGQAGEAGQLEQPAARHREGVHHRVLSQRCGVGWLVREPGYLTAPM